MRLQLVSTCTICVGTSISYVIFLFLKYIYIYIYFIGKLHTYPVSFELTTSSSILVLQGEEVSSELEFFG